VIATNTAIIATATRLAEPRSAWTRFGRCDRFRCDGDARQQRRARSDSGDDQLPVTPQQHRGPVGRNTLRCNGSRTIVTARRETGGLTCGVDTTNLHRYRGEP
jgi:hypothetical protein